MKSRSKEKKKGTVQHVLLPDFLSASGAPNTPTFATHAQYTNKPDANGAPNTPTFATRMRNIQINPIFFLQAVGQDLRVCSNN